MKNEKMIIFASDLDNTLIYGKHRLDREGIVVESYKDPAYMLERVHKNLQEIHEKITFVPITTRSISQYFRIKVTEDHPPLAFCSNGGNMIVKGEISKEYSECYKKSIENSLIQLKNCINYLEEKGLMIREVDDLFYYTKTQDENLGKDLRNDVESDLLEIEFSVNKLYIFPKSLNKSIAIDQLRTMFPEATIISAGDSVLDEPMLMKADIALTTDENKVPNGISCEDKNFSEFVTDYVLEYIKG